ncbi:MAG: hypothetical protein HGA47_15395 [Zoogloea sp.]|nr:hypothetical protein [Zoogloea sp.]
MFRGALTGQRLLAIFMLGLVLFDYPVLSLFNRLVLWAGIPLLFAYVFIAWAVLIGLMAWVAEHRER